MPPGVGFLEAVYNLVCARSARGCVAEWQDPRVMVYVRTPVVAEEDVSRLDYPYHNRELGMLEDKRSYLETARHIIIILTYEKDKISLAN